MGLLILLRGFSGCEQSCHTMKMLLFTWSIWWVGSGDSLPGSATGLHKWLLCFLQPKGGSSKSPRRKFVFADYSLWMILCFEYSFFLTPRTVSSLPMSSAWIKSEATPYLDENRCGHVSRVVTFLSEAFSRRTLCNSLTLGRLLNVHHRLFLHVFSVEPRREAAGQAERQHKAEVNNQHQADLLSNPALPLPIGLAGPVPSSIKCWWQYQPPGVMASPETVHITCLF